MTGQSHMVRRAGQFGGGGGVKGRVIWEQGRVSLLLTAGSLVVCWPYLCLKE